MDAKIDQIPLFRETSSKCSARLSHVRSVFSCTGGWSSVGLLLRGGKYKKYLLGIKSCFEKVCFFLSFFCLDECLFLRSVGGGSFASVDSGSHRPPARPFPGV